MPDREITKNAICYMCGKSCPMKVHVVNGRAVKIERADKGIPCPRWRAQLDFVYHPDRLTYPLRRTGDRGSGSFERISWEEALDTVATNLQKARDNHGAESVAFWIAYTKEPRPYFRRFTHAFGSPNYCTESSSCFTASSVAAHLNYGPGHASFVSQAAGIDPATRCKVIWGSSIQNSAPEVWQAYVEAKDRGLKLIVIDPCRTKIASMADIHLQPRPGTDGALALGMLNVIISENLHDREFIEKWTLGFDKLEKLLQEYQIEHVERITWVPAAKIKEAAILYATQKPSQLTWSIATTTHHSNGVQSHRAIILLPAITGNLEVAGGNRTTVQDGKQKKDITLFERTEKMPPGIGALRFPIWTRVNREMQSNALADQIDSSDPYPIKALFSAGLNVQFFPNSNRIVESLKKLDFIAVTDYFLTPGAQLADIVLPIASWLERHMLIDGPGRNLSLIEPAIEPLGESWSEWKIYSELARKLGFGEEFWDGDFEKCVNYIVEPLGVNYEYLKHHPEGIQNTTQVKTERHYEKAGFPTPSGKVEIASAALGDLGFDSLPAYTEPAESPVSRPDLVESYPLVLTSGARTLAYTHSLFRNIARLRRAMPEPLVDIHPTDAGNRGIRTGDTVIISSPRGNIKMKANVTDTILAGVVSAPHHWPGEANINILIDDLNLDPVSGFPPFKSQLCQVRKA
ncbi:molybdopterin-dependent oxidoreductase [Chloroflexota bacterium]